MGAPGGKPVAWRLVGWLAVARARSPAGASVPTSVRGWLAAVLA
jgi:hypothetical protein